MEDVHVFLYGAQCWTLKKKMNIYLQQLWLRKLAGVSRRQRKNNEDIRLDLNQMETLVQKI